jgi:predicted transcriptional regulator
MRSSYMFSRKDYLESWPMNTIEEQTFLKLSIAPQNTFFHVMMMNNHVVLAFDVVTKVVVAFVVYKMTRAMFCKGEVREEEEDATVKDSHSEIQDISQLNRPKKIRLQVFDPSSSSAASSSLADEWTAVDSQHFDFDATEHVSQNAFLFEEYLERFCARDVPYHRDTIFIDKNSTSIKRAFSYFMNHDINYAFVTHNDEVVSVMNMRHIVTEILSSSVGDVRRGASTSLGSVVFARADTPLSVIIRHLVRHRCVGVVSDEGTVSLITQGSLLRHMYEHCAEELQAIHVEDCNLVREKNIYTVPHNMSVEEVAMRLVRAKVTSLPVIDDDGVCVSIFSQTDLQRIDFFGDPTSLQQGCYSFLKRVKRGVRCNEIITFSVNNSLYDIIYEMLRHDVHHLYLLHEGVPVNVISFVDILSVFVGGD